MSANEQLQAIMAVFNQPHYATCQFTVGDVAAFTRDQHRRTEHKDDQHQRQPTTAADHDHPDDRTADDVMAKKFIEFLETE